MGLEKVADGVWLLRGDFRGAMNVYFIEDGDGVVQFDAGTKGMRKKARAAGEQLGGTQRLVLDPAHTDHRGTAPYMGPALSCHPDVAEHSPLAHAELLPGGPRLLAHP